MNKETARLLEVAERLSSVALTARSRNTPEWLDYLMECVNEYVDVKNELSPHPGNLHFRFDHSRDIAREIKPTAPTVEKEGA